MYRRGISAALLALLMSAGFGIAAAGVQAATPGPNITPPPKCFVMKGGELPTCEQNPDGTWNVIYSRQVKATSSNTKRDIELAISIAAIIGIGVIAWREWGPSRS